MPYRVKLHPEVYQDLTDIVEDEAYEEVKGYLRTLETNPYFGQVLENRPDLGIDLKGFRKIYVFNKKYRIVYKMDDNGLIEVYVIAIGERDKLKVYEEAYRRTL